MPEAWLGRDLQAATLRIVVLIAAAAAVVGTLAYLVKLL
jgi:hypothetical protein